jgi:hypothetical protein
MWACVSGSVAALVLASSAPKRGRLTQLEPPLAKSTYDLKTEEWNEYTIRDAAGPHLDGLANPQHIRVLADNLDPENASRREKRMSIACERHVVEFPCRGA